MKTNHDITTRTSPPTPSDTGTDRTRRANRVTLAGTALNAVLVVAKLGAGILGRSQAMVADAIHTLTDFATDIVVLVGLAFSRQPRDREHPYGHGKFETLAAVIIALALAGVGLRIGWTGGEAVWAVLGRGETLPQPHWLAFAAALLSVVVKEWLYQVTVKVGRDIDSPALMANAWHHRSDALSSIGTTLGIGGAVFLGPAWAILDPLAALVVSIFVIKAAWEVSRASLGDLIDSALPPELQEELLALAASVRGVTQPHNLRTRKVGPVAVVEVHIRVNPDLTVVEGHALASGVEKAYRDRLGTETIVTVHVEPLH